MKECISELATQPLLYTDTISGNQVLRDDLWVNSTLELNDNFDELTTLREQVLQLQVENQKMRGDVAVAFSKLKSLPRFSFLSPKEGGVRRFADTSGNWIEHYEAVKIYDALDEVLSTQPSTTLAEHDEAVRASEREAILENIHMVSNKTTLAIFEDKETADAYMGAFPCSVSGGMTVAKCYVIRAVGGK